MGQLPPGYLPLTTANGLGGLAAYTLAAAADVAAQNGQVPPLTSPSGSSSDGQVSSPSASSPFGAAAFGGNGAFVNALFGVSGSLAVGTTSATTNAATGKAHGIKIGFIQLPNLSDTVLWIRGLPVGFTLTLALLVALAALTTLFLGRRRQRW